MASYHGSKERFSWWLNASPKVTDCPCSASSCVAPVPHLHHSWLRQACTACKSQPDPTGRCGVFAKSFSVASVVMMVRSYSTFREKVSLIAPMEMLVLLEPLLCNLTAELLKFSIWHFSRIHFALKGMRKQQKVRGDNDIFKWKM